MAPNTRARTSFSSIAEASAASPLGLRSRGRLSSLTSDGEASATGIQLVATSNAALPRRAAGAGETVAADAASAWAEMVLWAEIATRMSRSRRKAGSALPSVLRAALCVASASSDERAESGGGKMSSLTLGVGRGEGVGAGWVGGAWVRVEVRRGCGRR